MRATHRGDAVECPCCGSTWGAFAADWNRPDAICPGCGAHERHRALALILPQRVLPGMRLLHFAPEHALRERLRAVPGIDYVTADLDPAGVDVRADITALPFEGRSFDAVLCSHVLEHVPDDAAAMREIRRVLRPGGWALVLVPVDSTREHTLEDRSVTDPGERERLYLQHDHVRLYAPDIADRLREAGLDVRAERVADVLPAGEVKRHGLIGDELVFHCTRPSSSGG